MEPAASNKVLNCWANKTKKSKFSICELAVINFSFQLANTSSNRCAKVLVDSFSSWYILVLLKASCKYFHSADAAVKLLSLLKIARMQIRYSVKKPRVATRKAVNFCVNRSRLALSKLRFTSASSFVRASFSLP